MSIVNVWREHGWGLIAADSTVVTHVPGEWPVRHSGVKMVTLPSCRMVLAARGDIVFFSQFVAELQMRARSLSIEAFASEGVGIANALFDMVSTNSDYAYLEHYPMGYELYALGYSPAAKDVAAYVISRARGDTTFAIEEIHSWCAAPQAHDIWPTLKHMPRINNVEMMVAAAKEQVRYSRTIDPDDAIGGKFVVAKVTMFGIETYAPVDLG